MLGRSIASLGRLRQITTVVARHGLDHYLERRRQRGRGKRRGKRLDESVDPGDRSPEMDGTEAAARRFRAILEDLGPTFIKFGQVLSTRPDILPPGFAETLASLQDNCPAMPRGDAELAVREGLGRPIDDLFREFDHEPIASASIAQVHRAVTHDGDEVAVKIQRPGIRARILKDLDLLAYLARLVEAIVEESGLVAPQDIVEQFESVLLGELDFEREAAMLRLFHANLEGKDRAYVVPRVYDELSSRTVLSMEFVRGANMTDLGPEYDKKKVVENLFSASFDQLFVDGVFHGDPHPGNAFVLPDNRLVLLDFGCVGQVSFATRETLVALVVSITTRDAETVARLLYRVGVPSERVSLTRLRDACASLFDSYLRDTTTLANVEASALLRDLFDLAARFGIRLPSEYALMARASVTTEGVIRKLDPDLAVLEAIGPYMKRLIEEQFTFTEVGDSAVKSIIRARGVLRELPLMASQILMDLETGKLQIQVDSPKFDSLARSIDALGVTVFMGLTACGLITGSFFLLARYEVELWGLPVVPIAALCLASILSGATFGRYFFAPRFRKFSVSRWLNERRRRQQM
ncbi:MAG: AarF/UbiB family protein [Myxococcota bacterium]